MSEDATRSDIERAAKLAAALRAATGKFKRKLREHGGSDLPPSHVSVVLRLEKDGPAAVSTLARAEGMRPQSMSAIVTSLLETRLVSGSPDTNDGRRILISLSPKCQKLLREGRAAKQDWLTNKIHEKLSVQDQRKLSVALEVLARLVED